MAARTDDCEPWRRRDIWKGNDLSLMKYITHLTCCPVYSTVCVRTVWRALHTLASNSSFSLQAPPPRPFPNLTQFEGKLWFNHYFELLEFQNWLVRAERTKWLAVMGAYCPVMSRAEMFCMYVENWGGGVNANGRRNQVSTSGESPMCFQVMSGVRR